MIASVLQYEIGTFGIDQKQKFNSAIPSVYTTVHTTATDTISDRNSTSTN